MTEAQKEVLRTHQRAMAKRATDFSQMARMDGADPDQRQENLAGSMHAQTVADAIGVVLRENDELVRLASSMVELPSEELMRDLYAAINGLRRRLREREERIAGIVETDDKPVATGG